MHFSNYTNNNLIPSISNVTHKKTMQNGPKIRLWWASTSLSVFGFCPLNFRQHSSLTPTRPGTFVSRLSPLSFSSSPILIFLTFFLFMKMTFLVFFLYALFFHFKRVVLFILKRIIQLFHMCFMYILFSCLPNQLFPWDMRQHGSFFF